MTERTPERSSIRLREKREHIPCTLDWESAMSGHGHSHAPGTECHHHEESSTKSSEHVRVKKTPHYAFGGPVGVTCIMLALPVVALYFNWLVMKGHNPSLLQWPHHVLQEIWQQTSCSDFLDLRALGLSVAWLGLQIVISLLPIGPLVQGQPLKHNGRRLSYRCNGFIALFISIGVFYVVAVNQPHVLLFMYEKWLAMITSFLLLSTFISVGLYLRSFLVDPHLLAERGTTGSVVYDFFMGRELNPRICGVDLKFVIELRPGLIGWACMDLLFCWIDVQTKVSWWQVNPALALVTAFHMWYVADALFFEEGILSTMDILDEGFGFMLCNGNLMVVPFVYSLTAHFVLHHPTSWPMWSYAVVLVVHVLAYIVFRCANYQKDCFRRGELVKRWPSVKVIPTGSGRNLLADGWWGMVRHPNYLGDILMAFSWSVPAGCTHFLPWIYPVYLVGLLVGREFRDEEHCERKYGDAWREYQKIVPHRIIPGIF